MFSSQQMMQVIPQDKYMVRQEVEVSHKVELGLQHKDDKSAATYKIALSRGVLFIIAALFIWNDIRLIVSSYEEGSLPVYVTFLLYGILLITIPPILFSGNKTIRTIGQILLFSTLYTDVL